MAKKMTYKQALEEIKIIVDEIENGEVDVDFLEQKLIKAQELFSFCQNKLKLTKDSVDKIINDVEE